MAIDIVTIQLHSVITEHGQYQWYNTNSNIGYFHDAIHHHWNVWGKIETVNGQSKQWCDEQWSNYTSILQNEKKEEKNDFHMNNTHTKEEKRKGKSWLSTYSYTECGTNCQTHTLGHKWYNQTNNSIKTKTEIFGG